MAYWVMKSEPATYSWDQFVEEKRTHWDGVRNFSARNNMKAMKKDDRCFFYHSNQGLEIVGIARVVREAYQDPTTRDNRWVVVDIVPERKLPQTVTLKTLKQDERTKDMMLCRRSRLSVSPVTDDEYEAILSLAGVKSG